MPRLFAYPALGLILMLGGCASVVPSSTYRLADNVYGTLPSASIEIIYLDPPDAPYVLQPSPDALAVEHGASGVMPDTGRQIVKYDPEALKRIQDEAKAALAPYQDEIVRMNFPKRLFENLNNTLADIPALAGAKVTRIPQPTLIGQTSFQAGQEIDTERHIETHDIALNSKAQIVIVISAPTAEIRYDGAAVGATLQLQVYAKPHPTEAVLQDHHLISAQPMPPVAVAEKYDLPANLQKLFADGSSPVSADLDATLEILDEKLRYYFHAIDRSPQVLAPSGN